jgi:hypothetical protein
MTECQMGYRADPYRTSKWTTLFEDLVASRAWDTQWNGLSSGFISRKTLFGISCMVGLRCRLRSVTIDTTRTACRSTKPWTSCMWEATVQYALRSACFKVAAPNDSCSWLPTGSCRCHLAWNFAYDPTAHTCTAFEDILISYSTRCPLLPPTSCCIVQPAPSSPPYLPWTPNPNHHHTITPRDVVAPTKSIKVLCTVLLGVTALFACLHSLTSTVLLGVTALLLFMVRVMVRVPDSSHKYFSILIFSFFFFFFIPPTSHNHTATTTTNSGKYHPPSITPSHCPLTYTHSHLLMAP